MFIPVKLEGRELCFVLLFPDFGLPPGGSGALSHVVKEEPYRCIDSVGNYHLAMFPRTGNRVVRIILKMET